MQSTFLAYISIKSSLMGRHSKLNGLSMSQTIGLNKNTTFWAFFYILGYQFKKKMNFPFKF